MLPTTLGFYVGTEPGLDASFVNRLPPLAADAAAGGAELVRLAEDAGQVGRAGRFRRTHRRQGPRSRRTAAGPVNAGEGVQCGHDSSLAHSGAVSFGVGVRRRRVDDELFRHASSVYETRRGHALWSLVSFRGRVIYMDVDDVPLS